MRLTSLHASPLRLSALLAVALLVACGQAGPLYLPDPKPAASPAATPTPAPAITP